MNALDNHLTLHFFLHRKLAVFQNRVDVLQTEAAEFHDAVAIFQNEVTVLKSKRDKLKDVNVKQKFEIELTGHMINKVSRNYVINEAQEGK